MAEAELIMERPVAMRLLHEAQIAEAMVTGLVTAHQTADHYYSGDWEQALQRAAGDSRRPWGVFAFSPGHFDTPVAHDFHQKPELLRITACLETKGVLQLRVYRCVKGLVEECALKIVD